MQNNLQTFYLTKASKMLWSTTAVEILFLIEAFQISQRKITSFGNLWFYIVINHALKMKFYVNFKYLSALVVITSLWVELSNCRSKIDQYSVVENWRVQKRELSYREAKWTVHCPLLTKSCKIFFYNSKSNNEQDIFHSCICFLVSW